MDIFHYSPKTFEYLGRGKADPDPMNDGEFLHPAFTTTVAPPEAADGTVNVYVGGGWQNMPDRRGETWWRADAADNTTPVKIDFIGDPKQHDPALTDVEPPAPPVIKVPIVLTAWQVRAALTQLGLRAAFEAHVTAGGQDASDAWRYGEQFSQDGTFLKDALAAVGQSPEQIDEFFNLAFSLKL